MRQLLFKQCTAVIVNDITHMFQRMIVLLDTATVPSGKQRRTSFFDEMVCDDV